MKKVLALVLIVAVVAFLAYALLRWASPDLAKQLAFYAIGLGAFVVGIFKKILSFFGSGPELDRAEARNDEIKADMQRIQAELATARERFEAERAASRREVERLEGRLTERRQEADGTAAERQRVRDMDLDAYFDSLTPEERRKVEAEMLEGVLDSSSLEP